MQAASLAVQLRKTSWKEKHIGDGQCLTSKAVAASKEVQTDSLLDLLQTNLHRADLWFACLVLHCDVKGYSEMTLSS